jgi:hypothetical protein
MVLPFAALIAYLLTGEAKMVQEYSYASIAYLRIFLGLKASKAFLYVSMLKVESSMNPVTRSKSVFVELEYFATR